MSGGIAYRFCENFDGMFIDVESSADFAHHANVEVRNVARKILTQPNTTFHVCFHAQEVRVVYFRGKLRCNGLRFLLKNSRKRYALQCKTHSFEYCGPIEMIPENTGQKDEREFLQMDVCETDSLKDLFRRQKPHRSDNSPREWWRLHSTQRSKEKTGLG